MNRKQRKEILEQALQIFNEKPKKAITYLQENGMLGLKPEEVADFLLKDDRLDKTMVRKLRGGRGGCQGEDDMVAENRRFAVWMYLFRSCLLEARLAILYAISMSPLLLLLVMHPDRRISGRAWRFLH